MRYRFCKDDINVKSSTQGIVLSLILDGHLKEHMYIGYSVAEAKKKFQQDFGVYPDDYIPVGVHPLNNHGGLAIMEIKHGIDDYVIVCDNYGDGYKNISKCRVFYNAKGRPYFTRHKQRYYLNEFMRV